MSVEWLIPAMLTIVTAATPLVFAAVGETVVPNMVQPQRTDAEGAPFPGGYLRLRNAGVYQSTAFDVIITVPSAEEATYPSDFLPIQYSPPPQGSDPSTLRPPSLILLPLG